MWLVLCATTDLPALWAYQALEESRLAPLELVTQEMLSLALRWNHWVANDQTGFTLQLADGRELDSRHIRGALNRVSAASSAHLSLAAPGDRDYAVQELTALLMSVLHAIPGRVLNRPSAQGLCGAWRHPSEWVWRAVQAGCPPCRMS